MKRYEQLAEAIADLIRSGTLPPGARLPSIRRTSQERSVSPSTVFQAYYLLESRGLIRARERSGYYVNEHVDNVLDSPDISQINHRSSSLSVSQLIFRILDEMRDESLVPLGSAFPSAGLFPLKALAKAFYSDNPQHSRSYNTDNLAPGNHLLRSQIHLRYISAGINTAFEDILITNGALEALNLALQAVTQEGDVVAIESPCFYSALQAIERLNLKAIEIPVHPTRGLDIDALEDAIQNQHVKACWCMSHFQNPVGASLTEDDKKRLAALVNHYQIPLIEDDVYGELYFQSQRPHPIKTYDQDGWVIHCSSFSKTLAPGYRVGWLTAHPRFRDTITRTKIMTTLSVSVPAQIAIARYLQQGGYDRHLKKLRHTLETEQIKMLTLIEQHFPAGTRVAKPQGGYFLWVKLPDNINALDLYQHAREAGISLAPGPIFSSAQHYQQYIRLNYGYPEEDNKQSITRLGELALASLKQSQD